MPSARSRRDYVLTAMRCDANNQVWEIRGADISLSPVYTAAASHLGSERGLSIRFPRFIRRREDKSWEEATTAEQ